VTLCGGANCGKVARQMLRSPSGRVTMTACLVAVVIMIVTTRGALGVGYDSVFYLSAANTLSSEPTLATRILHSERLARLGNLTGGPSEPGETDGQLSPLHPYTAWPPGYAAAIATLMTASGASALDAALFVNLIALIALIAGTAQLGGILAGPHGAALSAVTVAVWPAVHTHARMVWSELLFLALAVWCLYWLARWFLDSGNSAKALVPVVLLAAAAIYTRYLGIVLLPVVGVVSLLRAKRDARPLTALTQASLALASMVGLVLPLFLRNLRLSASIGGAERLPAEPGVLKNLGSVIASAYELLPLVRTLLNGALDSMLTIAALILVAGALLIYARAELRRQPVGSAPRIDVRVAWVLALYAVLHTGAVAALRTRALFDTDGRLLLPSAIGAIILGSGWLALRAPARTLRLLIAAWLVLGTGITVADAAAGEWRGFHRLEERDPLRRWVSTNLVGRDHPEALIFTDHVEMVHFFTGRPVHLLPAVSSLPALVQPKPDAGPGVKRVEAIFIVPEASFWFATPEAQRDYEAALTAIAKRVHRGQGFTVWFAGGP